MNAHASTTRNRTRSSKFSTAEEGNAENSNLPLCTLNPSASVPSDEGEGRYFRLFQEKLAFDFCGHFKTPFWTRLVLQECHREPAVRHAILALAALYKSAASRIYDVEAGDNHLHFSLVQHSKAIRSLRQTLSDGHPQNRLAIMSSLLLGSFESLHGNWETAMRQVYGGLNILKYLQEDRTRNGTQHLAIVDPEIRPTLRRLKLQLLSFLAMIPQCLHKIADSGDEEAIDDIPDRFITLQESFTSATGLAICTLQHQISSARCRDDEGPLDLVARQRDVLARSIDQWNRAYGPIFLEASRDIAGPEYLGALQLRICIWVFEIMISTSMSTEEIIFDSFTAQFERIVHFSRVLLEKDEHIRKSDGLRVQYGMGLIMSLFYTGTRCRDRFVRKYVISMLRGWPCMNGIWDSLQAAKVIEWIMGVEEGCSGDGIIAEESRIRMNTLKVNLENDEIAVECMQRAVDGVLKPRKAQLPWP